MSAPDDTPVWRRNEPDSPCVQVCVIHPVHGICIGCHRTAAEIAGWRVMSTEERARLRDELPGRGEVLRVRRGGRGARRGGGAGDA